MYSLIVHCSVSIDDEVLSNIDKLCLLRLVVVVDCLLAFETVFRRKPTSKKTEQNFVLLVDERQLASWPYFEFRLSCLRPRFAWSRLWQYSPHRTLYSNRPYSGHSMVVILSGKETALVIEGLAMVVSVQAMNAVVVHVAGG